MKPKIVISSRDAQKLDRLLASLADQEFPGRDDLEAELARALIVDPQQLPPGVVNVQIGSIYHAAPSFKQGSPIGGAPQRAAVRRTAPARGRQYLHCTPPAGGYFRRIHAANSCT